MAELEDGDSVEVQGSGSARYTLKRLGDAYSCTCPAWQHQGATIDRRTCKHLRAYLGEDHEAKRVGVAAPGAAAPASSSSSGAKTSAATPPPVLLAHKWEVDHDPTGWWMSEKLDGIRAYWDGEGFVSRLGNRFVAPAWFVESLPANTLDGELFAGRKLFQKTTSIVRSGAGGDAWKQLRYVVFDAPNHGGTFEERSAFCRELLAAELPYAAWHEHVACEGFDHLRRELARVEGLGGEGLMLRQPRSPYVAGRSSTLLKVKTFHDTEARVVDHVAGAGKHKGRLGSLLCELPDGTRFNVGTGFSDAERTSPPPIGAVITFRYQELTPDGVPRFPSYVGVRVDVELPSPGPASAKRRGAVLAPAPAPAPAGTRLVLADGERDAEATLVVSGATVGWRAVETFTSEKAAKRALADLRASLIAQGYEEE
jgi:DNA ligase-1